MAGRQFTVSYEDGSTETIDLKPKHLIQAERHLNKDVSVHSVEATFVGAWKALRSRLKFDDWLDSVESLEEVKPADGEGADGEEEGADPTPGPSPDE